MTTWPVFVYGTLKPGERNHALCQPWLAGVQPAWVRGELYDLPACGYPALAVGDRWVAGVLLQLTDAIALAKLDELEDYDPTRPPEANEYERRWTPICNERGEPLGTAWVYWMARSRIAAQGGRLVTSGRWSGTGG